MLADSQQAAVGKSLVKKREKKGRKERKGGKERGEGERAEAGLLAFFTRLLRCSL